MTVGDVATTTATSNSASGSFWNHVTMATLRSFGIIQKTSTGSTPSTAAQNFSDPLYHDASTAASFLFRIVDDISSTTTTSAGAGRTPFQWLIWSYDGPENTICKTLYHSIYYYCFALNNWRIFKIIGIYSSFSWAIALGRVMVPH